ncbi:MAG: tetratricopeptide repeat protein [Oscillospiraceae bacterium]|jgi:tetratricopeptide (TPR) repeat protein|nr:tetratricopeptide repeat protein [Oscillospiraceae bacterium]
MMGLFTNFGGNAAGQKALLAHQRGNYEQAAGLYEEAFRKGCARAAVRIGYGALLLRLGRAEESIEQLRLAEKASDVSKEQKNQIITHYAVAQYKLGNLPRALELLRELFSKRKTGLLYGALGCMLIETGDYEAALSFNKEAVEYDEDDPVCLDNLAQTYYRLGDDKQSAEPLFRRALEAKPESIDTLYFLAQYDMDRGDADSARAKLEKARAGRFSPLNHATPELVEQALRSLQA